MICAVKGSFSFSVGTDILDILKRKNVKFASKLAFSISHHPFDPPLEAPFFVFHGSFYNVRV